MRNFMMASFTAAALFALTQPAFAVRKSTVVGAATGAAAGAVVGGPAGAAVGGVAGGVVGSKVHRRGRHLRRR